MAIPPRQSSLWNNNARLARSRSDSKKTRHRRCVTRIGRQNKAFAYLNSSGAVNKKTLLQHAFSCAVESKLTVMICSRMIREEIEKRMDDLARKFAVRWQTSSRAKDRHLPFANLPEKKRTLWALTNARSFLNASSSQTNAPVLETKKASTPANNHKATDSGSISSVPSVPKNDLRPLAEPLVFRLALTKLSRSNLEEISIKDAEALVSF
jgi:hypothetical protein